MGGIGAQGAVARRAGRPGRAGRGERTIFGVPERFMRPRLVLLAAVAVLVGFGLLMVYSASSVSALSDTGDAAYYLKRQLIFVAGCTAIAAFLAFVDYHVWVRRLLMPVWLVTVGMLVAVIFLGTDNDMGATRWIDLGFFDLQPSELAKAAIILTAANLAERYFDEGSLDWGSFVKLLVAGVGVPLALILIQPDKGSTMVVALTLVVMGYLAGMPKRLLLVLLVVGVVGFLAISLRDDYSRQRLIVMFNPESSEFRYGAGWQLVQGFYAFGTGGLLGVGVGFSRQKYSYLPMAHNDFIFAVIGEECGLLGTIGLLVGFSVFLWAGFQVTRYAPDLAGRLVAAGCTSIVIIQLLLNVCGVLGLFPMSGKPIPFISYGGSSTLGSFVLLGLVLSVSRHSRLPETAHDGMRRSWQLQEGDDEGAGPALSFVGEPTARSQRATGPTDGGRRASRGFTVVEGGARPGGGERRGARAPRGASEGRRGAGTSGRKRIDLGPSAAERLRTSRGSGPRTRR